jgi:hypothetical protein
MPQYVFVHKKTRGGYHYFIAYEAVGNRPIAVSKFAYVDETTALHDVIEQIRQGQQFLNTPPEPPAAIPSAAAGGVR